MTARRTHYAVHQFHPTSEVLLVACLSPAGRVAAETQLRTRGTPNVEEVLTDCPGPAGCADALAAFRRHVAALR